MYLHVLSFNKLQLLRDEVGRPFIEFSSRRKWAKAKVKVIGQGTGRIEINGQDILYFQERKEKEQVLSINCVRKAMRVKLFMIAGYFPIGVYRYAWKS